MASSVPLFPAAGQGMSRHSYEGSLSLRQRPRLRLLRERTVRRPDPLLESDVLAREGGFQVEILRSEPEKQQGYRLRHLLFAETLRWVPETPDGLEIDDYDQSTDMVAVLDNHRSVLGLIRMHPSTTPYMIEKEFTQLLGPEGLPPKGADNAELTRFGVHPDVRTLTLPTSWGICDVFTLLLKGLYAWSKRHEVDTVFAVTDQRVLRLLRMRGVPFEPMGAPHHMPDGVHAVAVRLDWDAFETQCRVKHPELMAWLSSTPAQRPARITEVRSAPIAKPRPPLESDSRRSISAGHC